MIDDPRTLPALLALAVSVGVVHTLVGPDHYLLIAAWARARDLGRRAVLSLTLLAGLLHCAASALLVFVSLWLLEGSAGLMGLQSLRGDFFAWALIGTGAAWLITCRRRRASAPVAGRPGMRAWLLVLFTLGPCEWLLPNALAAGASHGWPTAALVVVAFTLATIATMVACVAVTIRLPVPRVLTGPTGPGIAALACGALVLAGL